MTLAIVLSGLAHELALFAAVGALLFAADDLLVDLIYWARRAWRSATIYSRFPRAFADQLPPSPTPGWLAVLVPAWDEGEVVARMVRTALERWHGHDVRLFVGVYRNDAPTRAALAPIDDARLVVVTVPVDGPSSKADCLNHLYRALAAFEDGIARRAKGVVLHDAEDLVHPAELRLYETMLDRADVVQIPVVALPDPASPWIAGHYCDEFALAHGRDLVVREAVGAAIPLAGVGAAIARAPLAALAAAHDGAPFAADSLTEDYEIGLRLGARGARTMFVRMRARRGSAELVASAGHFPATLDAAVRQKTRWVSGIVLAGWDRLGWSGGWGERWFRLRDRRGLPAMAVLVAGYAAAFLWAQLALAKALGAPVALTLSPLMAGLLKLNLAVLGWRLATRALFTARLHGWREGLRAMPRMLVSSLVLILAMARALKRYRRGARQRWDKTDHRFPALAGEPS